MKNLSFVVVLLAVGAALLWQTKRFAVMGREHAALQARVEAAERAAATAKADLAKAI